MSFEIAGIAVPGPGEVLEAGRSAAGWSVRTVDAVAGLPERVEALLEAVEKLVRRIDAVAERAEGLVGRIDTVAGAAEKSVASVNAVVGQAADASRQASDLVGEIGPLAKQALPLAEEFVRDLTQAEVAAAVKLVDQLPELTDRMQKDVLPLLGTLDRVGPDINELVDVVKDLRGMLDGVPLLSYLRRRLPAAEPADRS